MRQLSLGGWGVASLSVVLFATAVGCPKAPAPPSAGPPPLKDEIPADQLAEVLRANREGIGHMERFVEYGDAVVSFREVRRRAPGLLAGSINLAIALLNDTGVKVEKAAEAAPGQPVPKGNFAEAIELLDSVLARDPAHKHAHYCKGIILQNLGDFRAAHAEFRAVADRDPTDGHVWLRLAKTLPNPARPASTGGPEVAKQLIDLYTKALDCNPYLVEAYYRIQEVYGWARQAARKRELYDRFFKLDPTKTVTGPGELSGDVYGQAGRYALCIDPSGRVTPAPEPIRPAQFAPDALLSVDLPAGDRWAGAADYAGTWAVFGRARGRFGASVASFDADRDGRLDLLIAAAVAGPDGLRDVLLLNRGGGTFEDASSRFGLPRGRASLGVAAADFDADLCVDVALTGVGETRLYRNLAGRRLLDVSWTLPKSPPALSPTARWLDMDQDGDLDLYIVNHCPLDAADRAFRPGVEVPGMANLALRCDGRPAEIPNRPESNWAPLAVAVANLPARDGLSIRFTTWDAGQGVGLVGGADRHTSVAWLDADDDGDFDLAIGSDRGIGLALNDRLGRFHAGPPLEAGSPVVGLATVDLDGDGRDDLVSIADDGAAIGRRNASSRDAKGTPLARFEGAGTLALKCRAATVADLDLDGASDLVGLPSDRSALGPTWWRGRQSTSPPRWLALGPDLSGPAPIEGVSMADLDGDPLPDLLTIRDGEGPRMAVNRGNGRHWLSVDLSGCWNASFDQMRSNVHGIGTRVGLKGAELDVRYTHATPVAGPSQSVGPFVLGLGSSTRADLVRLRWPDNVGQCEMAQPADAALRLSETNRKTGSCPVLFSWDGRRFACIGDFLGGGGLGFLVRPGVYGQPDRDEAMFVGEGQLREVDGVYRLAVVEPMDESAYMDRMRLDVVDLPPGVEGHPDERFAPGGNRPTGDLITWRRTIPFSRATDLSGRDVSGPLGATDGRTVDGFRRLAGWVGYTEDHGIVLDFGDRLARLAPSDRPVLVLDGWVEYPYSSTNLAAANSGVPGSPPVLERLGDDGVWRVLEADPGYPAGLPRRTTLELTGKLGGPRCVLRIKTNMECYYDHAFIALRDEVTQARVTTIDRPRARLGHRGYLREVPTDGRPPLIYDYDRPDPAPLASMSGPFTRYGDVAELMADDDDHFCVVGPGEDLRVEFDARGVPPIPAGWRRVFIVRSEGYCKDADAGTATGDSILPFPWKGMPPFPFAAGVERPSDPAYADYLRRFQDRIVEP